MQEPVRVLVLGTGKIGTGIAQLVLSKPGLELVGAFGRRSKRDGLDLGQAIGLGQELGIEISSDLPRVLDESRPHVAIQATCSTVADAIGEVSTLLHRNVHTISIAEEMAYPAAGSPETARDLDRLARVHGVSLLGTGVNPGFVLDLLIITLTGVCSDIRRIVAKRTNDLAPYGYSVLKAQGIGLSREEFKNRLDEHSIIGHIGFRESIHMIASSIGWKIDRIDESLEPIIAGVERETPLVKVKPGCVAGCLHSAVAYTGDRPLIELIHPQQVHPHLEGVKTGDSIRIEGTPDIQFHTNPEIPGALATIALAVNVIPRVISAEPGLHSMADLPVPAAMLADARKFVSAAARIMT